MIKRHLTYFFLCLYGTAVCQTNPVYPEFLSTYFYNMAAIDPGYVPDEGLADFASGYQFHQGQLKKVSSLSFSATRIFRKENDLAQAIRFTAYNDQQGPFISSPKGYLNYAIRIPIGEESNIYSGIALGTAGIYFSAPTFSYSAFLPDGSFGLGINHRKVGLGMVTAQMFDSRVARFGDTYKLGRFYIVHANAEKELNLDWNLKAYALWRNLPYSGNDIAGTLSVIYKETVTLGTTLRYQAGMSFYTAFQLNAVENNLLLALTYNAAPVFSGLQQYHSSMEISLGFRMN